MEFTDTLIVQLYLLGVLITWLGGVRLYRTELFNNYQDRGAAIFCCGVMWLLFILVVGISLVCIVAGDLLEKMNRIKF
jgi:hypothetical protein